jgi:hypothetical protein
MEYLLLSAFCKDISTRFAIFFKEQECVNIYFGEYKDLLMHHMNPMHYKLEGHVLQYDNINYKCSAFVEKISCYNHPCAYIKMKGI